MCPLAALARIRAPDKCMSLYRRYLGAVERQREHAEMVCSGLDPYMNANSGQRSRTSKWTSSTERLPLCFSLLSVHCPGVGGRGENGEEWGDTACQELAVCLFQACDPGIQAHPHPQPPRQAIKGASPGGSSKEQGTPVKTGAPVLCPSPLQKIPGLWSTAEQGHKPAG